jgi:hypothetical protein
VKQTPLKPQLLLPRGTQVVTREPVRTASGALLCPAGTVGMVVQVPVDDTHSYRVALPGGRELSLKRRQVRIRKQAQEEDLSELQRDIEEVDLYRHVIYRCIVGSRAYGLDDEGSDTDRRGIYLPPADLHWSLFGVPEQLENREAEEVLLGAGEVPDDGAQGQSEHPRVLVHAAGRDLLAAGRGAARHAIGFSIAAGL